MNQDTWLLAMSVNCVMGTGQINVSVGDGGGDSSEEKSWELGWGVGGETQRRGPHATYRSSGNKACAP